MVDAETLPADSNHDIKTTVCNTTPSSLVNMATDGDTISFDSQAVVRKLTKTKSFFYKLVTVDQSTLVDIAGSKFYMDKAVGERWGTLFRVNKQTLQPVLTASEVDQFEHSLVSDRDCGAPTTSDKDNRVINDCSDNQKLDYGQLNKLRTAQSGEKVIGQLIDNSKNFELKTAYSQEKYIRKKKEKYMEFVCVLKPSVRVLSEMGWQKGKSHLKIRIDSLSQVLNYANVQYDSRVLMVDESAWHVVSHGVFERLHSSKSAVLHFDSRYHTPDQRPVAPRNFLIGQTHWIAMEEINSLVHRSDYCKHNKPPKEQSMDIDPSFQEAKRRKLDDTNAALQAAKDALLNTEWHSLIVVAKCHPLPLVSALMHFLGAGRPFVVFSLYLDAMYALVTELRERKLCFDVSLTDCFLRKYQILPDRCRPQLKSVVNSGFILHGFKLPPGEIEDDLSAEDIAE